MTRVQTLIITVLGLTLACIVWLLPPAGFIDRMVYDRMLSMTSGLQRDSEVLIVAIDDTSLDLYAEPMVMWHDHLAEVINAASGGGAKSIGVDLIPAVSMEKIAPQLDINLMQAIRSATLKGTTVVLGFSAGQHGILPERKFAMVSSGLGFLNLFPDDDGVVRKQTVHIRNQQGQSALSLAMILAGLPVVDSPERYNSTYIDYRQAGVETVSLASVVQYSENRNTATLRRLFDGKTVLIGVTSLRLQDFHRIPATLTPDGNGFLPGVEIHARMVQSLRHGTLRREIPAAFNLFLIFLIGSTVSWIFLSYPPRTTIMFVIALVVLATSGAYWSFTSGYVLSASAMLSSIIAPGITGLVYHLFRQYQLTITLNRFFRTYVNLNRLEDMMANPWARLQQEKQLKDAIERREQYLCYQPKVNTCNGAIAGMEALVRWRKPNGEFISPGHFIPLAEETGLINRLTELVIDRACMFASSLSGGSVEPAPADVPRISINLSALDLERPDLVVHILRITSRHGISPWQIDLEITESSVIHDLGSAIEKITALRQSGFTISIDDFGTGQSSLGYITQIPFDYLKIDKSLIDNIATERRARAVVSAIVAMSKGLGARVIAEGVEDVQQVRHLQNLGCDQIQGYFFSKPLEEAQMFEMVSAGKVFPLIKE